jgi:hypothetical protein
MDAATALIEEAQHIASGADNRARQLQAQLDDIKAKKLAVDAELERAKSTSKRLLNYQPRVGRDFQCPRCWVQHEVRAPLSSIPGTDEHDILRCHTCGADWMIPLR